MYERFTVSALTVVRISTREAQMRGAREITIDHLVLALTHTDVEQSCANRILDDHGIGYDWVVQNLVGQRTESEETPARGFFHYSRDATDLHHQAQVEALKYGHHYIGTEHLLLAILNGPECEAKTKFLAIQSEHEWARQITELLNGPLSVMQRLEIAMEMHEFRPKSTKQTQAIRENLGVLIALNGEMAMDYSLRRMRRAFAPSTLAKHRGAARLHGIDVKRYLQLYRVLAHTIQMSKTHPLSILGDALSA